MSHSIATRWSMIRAAAEGSNEHRDEFSRCYGPAVRAYLCARWGDTPRREDIDDATQEVFVHCFRTGGVLARADRTRPGGFRAFFYGVVRHVALQFEAAAGRQRDRARQTGQDLDAIPNSEEALTRIFDRAFAMSVLREARDRMAAMSRDAGARARKRHDLLLLRFHEGLSLGEIALRWGVDVQTLYWDQTRAFQDFRAALAEVLASHHPGTPAEIRRQSEELLLLLRRE
jgi:RNA polymerase sigma factor (sigma-70 family)